MIRPTRRALSITALTAALAIAPFTACSTGGSTNAAAAATTTTTSTSITTTTAPASVGVDAKLFQFSPRQLTVSVGTLVTWTFYDDPFAHNVTFDDGTASPNIGKGTWSRTFTTPGTYTYHCTIHPNMTATITVS